MLLIVQILILRNTKIIENSTIATSLGVIHHSGGCGILIINKSFGLIEECNINGNFSNVFASDGGGVSIIQSEIIIVQIVSITILLEAMEVVSV